MKTKEDWPYRKPENRHFTKKDEMLWLFVYTPLILVIGGIVFYGWVKILVGI